MDRISGAHGAMVQVQHVPEAGSSDDANDVASARQASWNTFHNWMDVGESAWKETWQKNLSCA